MTDEQRANMYVEYLVRKFLDGKPITADDYLSSGKAFLKVAQVFISTSDLKDAKEKAYREGVNWGMQLGGTLPSMMYLKEMARTPREYSPEMEAALERLYERDKRLNEG